MHCAIFYGNFRREIFRIVSFQEFEKEDIFISPSLIDR